THHFIGSAPCMPARRELFSGRKNEFLWKFWGAVEPFDRLLPNEANSLGAVTALVTDHYHYWEPGTGVHGYHENYSFTNLIRGHEYDVASSEPLEDPEEFPNWVKAYLKWRPPVNLNAHYYRNVKHFKGEKDFHAPKVMQAACDWLDRNHSHDKFFLHIESFDPHEPWYVPEPYRSMYGPYNENFTCWPPYQNGRLLKKFFEDASEEELLFVRNQYSGKVTMVDKWLGKIWDKMDQYNLWENTCVIVTTDHGHALAEPNKKIKQYGKGHPIFEDVANIPLIIYHPEVEGNKKIDTTFSTIVDIRATILEVLGGKLDEEVLVDGKSLIPVLRNEVKTVRDYVICGIYGAGVNLTTWDYTYIRGFNINKPLFYYSSSYPLMLSPGTLTRFSEIFGQKLSYDKTEELIQSFAKQIESGHFIPGVKIPQWKIPAPVFLAMGGGRSKVNKQNYLFDRKKDPNFQNNLAGTPETEELEKKILAKLIEILKKEGCPPEQYKRLMLNV
ncbi:MAG: sulfatase, partial [Candidatus Hodarchaeota archaeon]